MFNRYSKSLCLITASMLLPMASVLANTEELPARIIVAAFWTTAGTFVADDLEGTEGIRETLDISGSQTVIPNTAKLISYDTKTLKLEFLPVDAEDPFYAQSFEFEPIKLVEDAIPVDYDVGVVPYVGQYGGYGTQFQAGILLGDVYPDAGEKAHLQVKEEALSIGSIDCCEADAQNLVYGQPNVTYLWLDTDDDQVPDANMETLLADNDIYAGDLNMVFALPPLGSCTLMPYLRGECGNLLLGGVTTTYFVPLFAFPDEMNCDVTLDDTFNLDDIRVFHRSCKDGTAIWDCDQNDDDKYSLLDPILFTSRCLVFNGQGSEAQTIMRQLNRILD